MKITLRFSHKTYLQIRSWHEPCEVHEEVPTYQRTTVDEQNPIPEQISNHVRSFFEV